MPSACRLLVLAAPLLACIPDRTWEFDAYARAPETRPLCAGPSQPGVMRCHARARTDGFGRAMILSEPIPGSLTPDDLRRAYAIPSSGDNGITIAIVAAYDDPSAGADLSVYRARFGLPLCSATNNCFRKVNQGGLASPLPAADADWAGEISLDLDMASATCPGCNLLLVEAASAASADLGAAVNTAVAMGASVVSMSWGGPEDASAAEESRLYYEHPGVLLVAAGGDDGYDAAEPEFPASAASVLAVGGTSLAAAPNTSRGFVETVWNSGGGSTNSGCSHFIAKPEWQLDTGCSMRTLNDVAAFADPQIGVAVYDSYGGSPGWAAFGGTSAATPMVAGIFAVTGNAGSSPEFAYRNVSAFFDVTSGTDALGVCEDGYLCSAEVGYDGPTGVGSPNGGALHNFAVASVDGGATVATASKIGRRRTTFR